MRRTSWTLLVILLLSLVLSACTTVQAPAGAPPRAADLYARHRPPALYRLARLVRHGFPQGRRTGG